MFHVEHNLFAMFKLGNIFKQVMMPKVPTNRFDLSHDLKLSFSMGELVPTCVQECMPGDRFSIKVENMLRFMPLISPVMHKVNVTTHYFFVPNRLLWSNWERWITGEFEGEAPFMTTDECQVGSLCDYLGFPTGTFPDSLDISPMPIAAYALIYDEYYRDQNLQPKIFVPLTGSFTFDYQTYLSAAPKRRAWMHDYFTSCLPFAQKGDAVQIPLSVQDNIPVEFNPSSAPGLPGVFVDPVSGSPLDSGFQVENQAGPVPFPTSAHINGDPAAYDPRGSLTVDIQTDATDINTLRRAFRLQEWLEKNARGGTRYIENIMAHFGVKSDDARLQRPEYIGGARQNMVISEVLATAQSNNDGSTAEVNVGQMAGHGISVGGGNRFNYYCREHGWIIGIINVQPVTAYQQGLHRKFTRFDKLDYPWPTFANIGEQEVRQKEVYINTATPEAIFGYIPRYSEMKFENSRVAGEMRSTLAFWHMGRIFDTDPALNAEFIECDPRTDIFAVTEGDHIVAHIFNDVSVVRKLPRFGIPTI